MQTIKINPKTLTVCLAEVFLGLWGKMLFLDKGNFHFITTFENRIYTYDISLT